MVETLAQTLTQDVKALRMTAKESVQRILPVKRPTVQSTSVMKETVQRKVGSGKLSVRQLKQDRVGAGAAAEEGVFAKFWDWLLFGSD